MATQSSVSEREAGSDSSPSRTASQWRMTNAPTSPWSPSAARPCSSAYLRAAPKISHCISSAVAVLPSARARGCDRERSAETWWMARTGSASARSRPGPASSSTMASTMAVVPTFNKVATSERLASPTMTWRRRNRLGSAWGSSRVLTMGRFKVVSSPTISSKNSARWEIWKWTVAGIERRRLHPDLARAGEDGARDEVRHHAFDHPGERDGPVHHVVLVAAVGVALAVGVVLVDDRRGHVGDTRLGGDHGAPHDLLAGLVIDQAFERGQAFGGGVLGVGVVDVEAGAVGEDGVGQVGLDHRGQRPLAGEAAGVVARRLVLEVPPDPLLDVRRVGVDQHRGGGNRILLRTGRVNAVLGLDPADLDGGHTSTLGPFRGTARYPPVRSTGRR